MDGDHPITPAQAIEVQHESHQLNNLMIWTVAHNTSDYGDQYVARPSTIGPGTAVSLPFVLLADTLAGLRDMLPPGLSRLARSDGDDPVIVEAWL